ncbi:MAG TPA: hypothetical protein VL096_11205, partial [Pirellulaceae bacterium]|nr:hypothetical protein [Pirellulaceae bacterium]
SVIETPSAAERVLGYLNYATGPAEPAFFLNLDAVATLLTGGDTSAELSAQQLGDALKQYLAKLHASSPAFQNIDQAAAVLSLVFDHALRQYREFHRDSLFHQTDDFVFNPFFIGRMCEAVIRQGAPWNETERIVRAAVQNISDYIGHRPVAVLESRKTEPYPREWIRPVPYYIRGAGVSSGRYHEVVEMALELLRQTDPEILRSAHFDPQRLEELAIDPRAYDFDHPANKRPNYHFGQWDPHQIDNAGYYRRFVVQQVTLDSLMGRLIEPSELPRDERLFEAGAVLAGTILMAAGISGSGPDTFDSSMNLAKLLPKIAQYRDKFYEWLFQRAAGEHAKRLRAEAAERRQPFGGARQHLNAQLARRRAAQLAHVHLAKLFARMGFAAAAAREANIVPAASARMQCQIDCHLTTAHQALSVGKLAEAANELPEIKQLLTRAIECGAVVDPWNILGFDANFSLFPALENSVRDHRCDELVAVMEQIFALYSRTWSEAAAGDQDALCTRVAKQFLETANWWHQFAVQEVSSVDGFHALDVYQASQHVARALQLWHQGGSATGDVAFWSPHADMFDTPKAYALVVEALLDRGDFVASMALLIHWLGQAERIGLEKADSSFTELAERWMLQIRQVGLHDAAGQPDANRTWLLLRKFVDYLEANAEAYGRAPQFELGRNKAEGKSLELSGGDEHDEQDEDLFGAAYTDMVYRDSTDDGVESETVEGGDATVDELSRESKRLSERLSFLACMARLWKQAAAGPEFATATHAQPADRAPSMRRWSEQAL